MKAFLHSVWPVSHKTAIHNDVQYDKKLDNLLALLKREIGARIDRLMEKKHGR